MKVFVTDADQKHALAAVRALGRENVEVHAGATTRYAVSFYSRYCHRKVVYPNPIADEKKFVGFLQKYTEQEKIDVLLPVGYDANVIASKYREVYIEICPSGCSGLRSDVNSFRQVENHDVC